MPPTINKTIAGLTGIGTSGNSSRTGGGADSQAPSALAMPVGQRLLAKATGPGAAKAAVLTLLLLVLGAMWVRMLLGGNGGAQEAIAASSHLSDNELVARAKSAARLDKAASALADWKDQDIPPLARNVFNVKLDYYPREGADRSASESEVDPGFWDRLAKSMAAQADQTKDRQVLVENLRLQAANLRLQTTLMGPKPKAVINGEVVREGDVVAVEGAGSNRATFRVLRIEARRVIVEREGIKLVIPMR